MLFIRRAYTFRCSDNHIAAKACNPAQKALVRLHINAPQNMIAYGTNTFEVRDFVRNGIPLTLIGFALILLLGSTYWKWLGLV